MSGGRRRKGFEGHTILVDKSIVSFVKESITLMLNSSPLFAMIKGPGAPPFARTALEREFV